MSSHSIQHYQTCFRVASTEKNYFSNLQKIIFKWISAKEKDAGFNACFSDFKHILKEFEFKDSRSRIKTTTCHEDNGDSWALRYEEYDKDHGALRFWYTDIGLREIGGEIVLFARISYAWNQSDLTDFQKLPQASVPRFIRDIFKLDCKIYFDSPDFRLKDKPVILPPKSGTKFANWIQSEERRYPVIVFNGNSSELNKEARDLSFVLAGKCQVFIIPENKDLAEEIKAILPRELDVQYGQFRVFFPITKHAGPARHRWFNVLHEEYSLQKRGIINGLLKKYVAFDRDAVESVSDIFRRINQVKIEKFKKDNPAASNELKEFYSEIDELAKARDEQKIIADKFAVQCDEFEAELNEMKYRLDEALKRAKQVDELKSKIDYMYSFKSLPSSLHDVMNGYSKLYSDKLVFAENAWKSAEKYSEYESLNEAWEMFYDLGNLLHAVKFGNPGKSMDLEAAFNANSKYELSMTETKATKKDKALMAQRLIAHDGVEYDITPHLKWGSREPKMLRINFSFDEVNSRFVVGYVGPHMDTAGTRRM